jgi:hypothetical protein
MPKSEFYSKWYEKWPNYLVRRPALMLDHEITPDGRQVMASSNISSVERVLEAFETVEAGRKRKQPQEVRMKKDPNAPLRGEGKRGPNPHAKWLAENRGFMNPGAHKNPEQRARGPMRKRKKKERVQDAWDSGRLARNVVARLRVVERVKAAATTKDDWKFSREIEHLDWPGRGNFEWDYVEHEGMNTVRFDWRRTRSFWFRGGELEGVAPRAVVKYLKRKGYDTEYLTAA